MQYVCAGAMLSPFDGPHITQTSVVESVGTDFWRRLETPVQWAGVSFLILINDSLQPKYN